MQSPCIKVLPIEDAAFEFLPNSRLIIETEKKQWIYQWDAKAGQLHGPLRHQQRINFPITYSPDGKLILSQSKLDNNTYLIHKIEPYEQIGKLTIPSASIDKLALFPDGQAILNVANNSVELWDVPKQKIRARFTALADGEWVVMTPEGFYNSSPNGHEQLIIRAAGKPYKIAQFRDALYRPDLVREALAGDPSGRVAAEAAELDLAKIAATGAPPQLHFLTPEADGKVDTTEAEFSIEIEAMGGGIGRVEWRVNGTTLGVDCYSRGLARTDAKPTQADAADCQARGVAGVVNERTRLTLTRSINLAPGENTIEVLAYNAANVIASYPIRRMVTLTSDPRIQALLTPPQLHVLAIGIDDYWDSTLRLNYAVSDARAMSQALHQAGQQLFESVHVHEVLDQQATSEGIAAAFQTIAAQTRPEDVFVLFVAGHGKTVNGRYYFIPQDFRYPNDAAFRDSGIAKEHWQAWLSSIKARKGLVLLDTCDSGALIDNTFATRSLDRNTALGKLARATGRATITATTGNAPALEGYRGHGVFTYVLLQALQQGDLDRNGLIETTELSHYVDEQVPEISYAAFGQRQQPWAELKGSHFAVGQQLAKLDLTLIPNNGVNRDRKPEDNDDSTQTGQAAQPRKAVPAAADNSIEQQVDLLFWQSIKSSDNPKLFRAYLKRFPNGAFVPLAKYRLKVLETSQ